MHLMIMHEEWKYYFKFKEHMLMAIEQTRLAKTKSMVAMQLLQYSTAAVGPSGLVGKDRLKGLRDVKMYSELWEYLKHEEDK
jgi:hypothetical protein